MIKLLIREIKHNSFLLFTIGLLFSGFFIISSSVLDIVLLKNDHKYTLSIEIEKYFNNRDKYFIEEVSVKSIKNSILENEDIIKVIIKPKPKKIDLASFSSEFYSIDNKTEKEKFIFSILPFIAEQNSKIRNERNKLLEMKYFLNINKTLNKKDQYIIKKLALNYGIDTKDKNTVDILDKLIMIVDEIPNSIVLAQAANESGWGKSRFAKEYNAFFGEYTFSHKSGVVPYNREEGKTHLIKFFPNVSDSIKSYFRNINTHQAYNNFREVRKNFRDNNISLDPNILIQHLKFYAEDENYIKNLRSIIRVNNLTKFDKIILDTRKS